MVKKELRYAVFLALSLFGYSHVQAARFLVPFDLPAGPLSEILIQFAEQAEVSLLVSKNAVADFETAPLKAVMTLPQALNKLLADTGLGYKFIDPDTVSISKAFYVAKAPTEAATMPVTGSRLSTIEEVTVTAQRSRQNLQKVPVAVTVLNQFELTDAQINDLTEVGTRVPGLTVSSYSLGQPTIHMRGIGSNDDGAAMDNSVVVFLDDVYVGRITHIDMNMLDMARVEVLRGPQGSLYGKNAIGGAIKLVSKLPTDHFNARLQASSGNFSHQALQAMVNGPLGNEAWLGRLAFNAQRRDGWQDNLITGDSQHDNNQWAFKAKLLHRPSDHLELHWLFDASQENFNSTGRIPVAARVPIRILDADGNPIPQLDIDGQPLLDDQGQSLFVTRLPTDIFRDLGGDARHATNQVAGHTDRDIWGLTQRVDLSLGNNTLAAITAVRKSRFDWLEDSTGLPLFSTDQTVGSDVLETHRQFSQELRWSSPSDQPLAYILGLYYLSENTDRKEFFPFRKARPLADQENTTHSIAAFGHLTYRLNAKTHLGFGARYTYDRKRLHQIAVNDGAPAVILEDFQLTNRDSWEDFSPFLSFAHSPNDDFLVYGSIAKGMKSGGFQGAPGTLETAMRTIDPEEAWDYELGFKSQWLQDRLRLNIAAFYTDYRDLQVVQFRTIDNFGVFETDNAASASLHGIETEVIASPLEGLTLSASYAYLQATYDSYNDPEGRDFTGNSLRQAPEHSANLVLHYEHPWWDGNLRWRGDYRYQSESFREPDNLGTRQPGYSLFDASLTYVAGDHRWELSLWGKNLSNREYIAHLYVLGGNDYALFGTPRTYGASIAWNFL